MRHVRDRDGTVWAMRSAEADDLDALLAIEREVFADPWSRTSMEDALAPTSVVQTHVMASEGTGEVVAFLMARDIIDAWEVINIAVRPAFRRRGLGRALMTGALEAAARRGCTTWLLEVREGNTAARALYRQLGYVDVGRRPDYYRHPTEDAILMTGRPPLPWIDHPTGTP
ncbi:MAG: ribosomal protein S18-alanine N-acetyltransferase [Saccharofermentanales bacterium]